MALDARARLDAFPLFSVAAVAGGNLLIGFSMGACRLSLELTVFVQASFGPWPRFLVTILPLLLMSLIGLIRSARRDARDAALWRFAILRLAASRLIPLSSTCR